MQSQELPSFININFELDCDIVHLLVKPSFNPHPQKFTEKFREYLKSKPYLRFDTERKLCLFPTEKYNTLLYRLEDDLRADWKHCRISVSPLPASIQSCLFKSEQEVEKQKKLIKITDENIRELLPPSMIGLLKPYQMEGLNFIIRNNCHCILGDDMGLGKTYQAICIYYYYHVHDMVKAKNRELPSLVICPSSLRLQWQAEFCKWMPQLFTRDNVAEKILVVLKGTDFVFKEHKIIIISYDLANKLKTELSMIPIGTIIADESHMLKNQNSQRTKNLTPILKASRRVLLLSGTPALSRPVELYSQLSIIRPFLFTDFYAFAKRYCAARKLPFKSSTGKEIWDYSGASNLAELWIVLTENSMIRRLKKDVLKDLPEKIREKIVLDVAVPKKMQSDMQNASNALNVNEHGDIEQGTNLIKMYDILARLKQKAVREYIDDLLEACEDETQKFLFFAHHQIVLDALEKILNEEKHKHIEYVRIDGSVTGKKRQERVDEFQTRSKCRVALLSITAAGTGLTLTAASCIVFCELFWTPSILSQCEARAHRLGQKNSVLIKYLIGRDTIEEKMWSLLEKKIDILSSMLDNDHKRKGMEAETVSHAKNLNDNSSSSTRENINEKEDEDDDRHNIKSTKDVDEPTLKKQKYIQSTLSL